MIKSMTGYGRAEYADEDLKIAVEIKSVNNRYLDIGIKMPRQLGMLEAGIRAELKKYISRGKVDVYITYEDLKEANMQVKYNSKIAGEYLKYLRQMAQEYGLDNDIRVSTLSKYPDVLTMEEEPMDPVQLWDRLRAVVDEAAENFREARVREGEFLRNDLIGKLNEMQGHVDFITERSPQIIAAYRQRLCDKVKELIGDAVIDDSRIVQEVTIYADKVCVDEELVRLQSHIKATREALDGSEGVGRKLDFIAQEMNRESNTILSKSDNLEVSDRAIELKTTVEKVREQIQNIE
ncbi:MAG: YicC family protein [Lachnospiraceae bacterium]|nr:YicC family protein [Lachnospiraceae bacterium]